MAEPLYKVESLSKSFTIRRGFPSARTVSVRAVDGASFAINEGEAFGLVGESGCGKSTLGRALLRLIEPDAGSVRFRDEEMTEASAARLRVLRRKLQIIFQDPYSSLNPRRTVAQTIAEPIRVHGIARAAEVGERVRTLLREVGLPAEVANRYPHEFSGGQRQRIVIARALSVDPEFIVADEPVSSLDVSIQAQILLLLKGLKEKRRLAYLFISHDLGVVRYFCERAAVMYLGRIVEAGPIPSLLDEPLHPYSKALRDASLVPDPRIRTRIARIEGDMPSPVDPPAGCYFHPRCPHVMAICRQTYPGWTQVDEVRGVACHLFAGQPKLDPESSTPIATNKDAHHHEDH
jgi:peptide/nickel transport system ATP-binding protein